MKSNIQKRKRDVLLKEEILTINQKLDAQTKKAINDASQPGASSWFSAIPLEQYGFPLNEAEFRDDILLRYGTELKGLPVTRPCGHKCDTTPALNYKEGGFLTIRLNNIRDWDYETNLLAKIHTEVETEPSLQPIEG